ncbi:MAG: sulfatase-like hydrolase/transferase [Deltaproteobacteria bacterium]|nr:sulfatase-like hydrolase/transferase [Deltaproteobacteria bacterium]
MAATTAALTWGGTGCERQRLAQSASSKAKRPNLVFVFSDQQSQDMLGCYGNHGIKTPHLDRLAAEGLRFNHCISTSPVCTPFRGMLMSGQHPLYCGAMHNDVPLLANNGPYFGHVLRDAGYRMGYVGKWHLLGAVREMFLLERRRRKGLFRRMGSVRPNRSGPAVPGRMHG